jgi:hypothetical protein
MATPVLNNGIFLRDTSYNASSHVDSYHLLNMCKHAEPQDLGVVDIWAMTQKVEAPLYQLSSFKGQNVISVDHPKGEWRWKVPTQQDMPYIVEDIETNDKPGMDGTTFKIKLNKRAFGHGAIISYDKMNGAEMFVVPTEDILPHGDGFVYTVQLVNNDNFKFLDKKFLKSGTRLFRKGSARGEYGERFDDLGVVGTGHREFYNFVGGSEAHAEYSVSSRAKLMEMNGVGSDGNLKVLEIWRNLDKSLDPSITSLNDMAVKMGDDYVKSAYSSGKLVRSWIPAMEAAHISKISRDIETYLMWGHGGRIKQDGPDDMRLSVGLWKQLDSSYKRIYNKANFNLDLFKSELFNFYHGKVEFQGPDPKRTIIVQTGMGGMKMVNKAIQTEAHGSGLAINATDIGAISGKGMDLNFGFAYTSYVIPFLANVKFVLNPAFDNVHNNDIENPIIDGFPLSSYSFVVFDITESGNDNIFLLKWAYDNELKWGYQNGTMDYFGKTKGFASTGRFNGYRVFMSQTMPALWVKDPTKVLKIVMKNPITGGSF